MTPNFFLVGTTKGGTSTLDLWLRRHPEVSSPPRKELHFFCECPDRLRWASTVDDYLEAFPRGRAVGESSPCYLYYPHVPARLAEFREARIIVSLRDPVERFWSHYLMNEAYRPTGLTPEALLDRNLIDGRTDATQDLFGVGLYGDQVSRYFRVFGRERVLVLFLEETAAAPLETATRLQNHLGITVLDLDTSEIDKQHVEPRGAVGRLFLRNPAMRWLGNRLLPYGARRYLKVNILGDTNAKPTMPENLRLRLQTLYATDSGRLEEALDRPLPWNWHHRSSGD